MQSGHLSFETLDLMLLAGLPRGDEAPVRAHLASCELCQGRLAETESDHQHFQSFVFPRTLPSIEAREARGARPRRWSWPRLTAGLLGAGLLVAAVLAVGGF